MAKLSYRSFVKRCFKWQFQIITYVHSPFKQYAKIKKKLKIIDKGKKPIKLKLNFDDVS